MRAVLLKPFQLIRDIAAARLGGGERVLQESPVIGEMGFLPFKRLSLFPECGEFPLRIEKGQLIGIGLTASGASCHGSHLATQLGAID